MMNTKMKKKMGTMRNKMKKDEQKRGKKGDEERKKDTGKKKKKGRQEGRRKNESPWDNFSLMKSSIYVVQKAR